MATLELTAEDTQLVSKILRRLAPERQEDFHALRYHLPAEQCSELFDALRATMLRSAEAGLAAAALSLFVRSREQALVIDDVGDTWTPEVVRSFERAAASIGLDERRQDELAATVYGLVDRAFREAASGLR